MMNICSLFLRQSIILIISITAASAQFDLGQPDLNSLTKEYSSAVETNDFEKTVGMSAPGMLLIQSPEIRDVSEIRKNMISAMKLFGAGSKINSFGIYWVQEKCVSPDNNDKNSYCVGIALTDVTVGDKRYLSIENIVALVEGGKWYLTGFVDDRAIQDFKRAYTNLKSLSLRPRWTEQVF